MAVSATIARVHDALAQLGTDCPIEEVMDLCPDLTWNQVFLAIDYLSRSGQVRVTLDPGHSYRVAVHRPIDHAISSIIPQVGPGASN
jgi:hypothetical protein